VKAHSVYNKTDVAVALIRKPIPHEWRSPYHVIENIYFGGEDIILPEESNGRSNEAHYELR
jgi:hypothetical protein